MKKIFCLMMLATVMIAGCKPGGQFPQQGAEGPLGGQPEIQNPNIETQGNAEQTPGEFALTVKVMGLGKGYVKTSDEGIFCGTDHDNCSKNYPAGSGIDLGASTLTDSKFVGWSYSACSSGELICKVVLDKDVEVVAVFEDMSVPAPEEPGLKIQIAPGGSGLVEAFRGPGRPEGYPDAEMEARRLEIKCGQASDGTSFTQCETSLPSDTPIILKQMAAPGYTFDFWTHPACGRENTCMFNLSGKTEIAANFKSSGEYKMEVVLANPDKGIVTSDKGGIKCGTKAGVYSGNCTAFYSPGTVVTLKAEPETGYTYSWDLCGPLPSDCPVTIDAFKTVRVKFIVP